MARQRNKSTSYFNLLWRFAGLRTRPLHYDADRARRVSISGRDSACLIPCRNPGRRRHGRVFNLGEDSDSPLPERGKLTNAYALKFQSPVEIRPASYRRSASISIWPASSFNLQKRFGCLLTRGGQMAWGDPNVFQSSPEIQPASYYKTASMVALCLYPFQSPQEILPTTYAPDIPIAR